VTVIEPSGEAIVYQLWYSDLKYVDDLAVDQENRLWLGTARNGLKVVDLNNGLPKPIPENWLSARTKLLMPIQVTKAFLEPIVTWVFLPSGFGPVGILYFGFLAGVVFGVFGWRKGIHDSNRSLVHFSRGVLAVSTAGTILLWSIACLLVFLFLRD
jgi:hypothetical protein